MTLQRTVHMVGNAHIDPVWLWSWPEGYQEARATFWSAIQRMEEYPDFVFTCNQVVLLAWVEESDPELFAAIGERIAEGRWIMTGGWWVEPDCNVPTGESFVRQGLYGQRYLHEKFGVTATVGLNADPFGHHAMLPQILTKQGLNSYCFLRPGPHEAELPGQPFWWEAPDGSRVLTYRIPHEYCSPRADITQHIEKAIAQLPPGTEQAMVFYGVGNHGGGPTKANIDSIHHLDQTDSVGSLRLSSPNAYFDSVRESGRAFPVWRDDLQHHAAGCYSAHSSIKKLMRQTEHALLTAEKWASVAAAEQLIPYPMTELTHAWKRVLFNQFHDILPGTAIEPAYDDARDELGEARAIARRVTNTSLQVIARGVDIPFDEQAQPVLVFNPHPWPVRAGVEIELGLFPGEVDVVDDANERVAAQPTRGLATVNDPRRKRVVFDADLPPLGYQRYALRPRRAEPSGQGPRHDGEPLILDNGKLRVEIDRDTGGIRSLVDAEHGQELIAADQQTAVVVADDDSDTWGHRVVSYPRAGKPFHATSARMVEAGPVRSIIRVESGYGNSQLIQEYVLDQAARHLEVRARLDWRERLKIAKLRIPTALLDPTVTYEIPYGHLQRPADGAEEPGQSWVDASGPLANGRPAGLALLNDAKAGYDVLDSQLGMTVVRSPVYAWHDPRELEDDGHFSYQDQGWQSFRYLLVPHDGDWRDAGIAKLAAELNQPPAAMAEFAHPGTRPARHSFVRDDGGSVQLVAIKRHEDAANQYVVRAYESAGRQQRTRLELGFLDRVIEADFSPAQIKTFLVPSDPTLPVTETDLLEYASND